MKKRGKLLNVILAIFLAVILWLYVVNVENPIGDAPFHHVSISVQGEEALEERGLMLTDVSRDTLQMTVTGKRKSLMKLSRENVGAVLDVSDVEASGEWTLTCKAILPTNSPETLSVSEKKHFAVTVTVEKRVTRKIDVVGSFVGTVANGYQADPLQINPKQIEITGPEHYIGTISHAEVTFAQEQVSNTTTKELPVVLVDVNGQEEKSSQLVSVTLPIVQVFHVPLTVRLQSGGGATAENASCTIRPDVVYLTGDPSLLGDMTEISLGEIDLSEVFYHKKVSVPIPIPEGLVCRNKTNMADIDVSVDLPITAYVADQIAYLNLPTKYTVTPVTNSLQVYLRGNIPDDFKSVRVIV
ncbi:MAG: CdaR family protein, partial [Evtepia sp.]